MRVLLTGATGFLGKRVLALLAGHEVLCLVRTAQTSLELAGARFLLGNLTTPQSWAEALARFAPQWCIHLAWEGLPDYSFAKCRLNLNSSLGLLEILGDCGVKRIVVAGTCWEYGSAMGAVKESHAPADCGTFASAKHALRVMLEGMARERRIEYRWARVFFAYGPDQRTTSLIPTCHAAFAAGATPAIRHPGTIQDFVYADDVAAGIVVLAEAEAESGIYNLGSGIPTAVGQVVNDVARHFGVPEPYARVSEGGAGFWADCAKTAEATGWRATTHMDQGIALTLRSLEGAR